MTDETFKNYLHDLVIFFNELAVEGKAEKDQAKTQSDRDYTMGYQMALCEVVSLMKQQAIVFGIAEEDLGLSNVDPETTYL